MTPTWRAARLAEPFSAELDRNKARMLVLAKRDLETVFAAELTQLAAAQAAAADRGAARDQHLVVLGIGAHRARP